MREPAWRAPTNWRSFSSPGYQSRTGRRELGINVFQVREVVRTPNITAAPDMPSAVGVCQPARRWSQGRPGALRGRSRLGARIMIVTEVQQGHPGFSGREAVDTILRLDWAQMRVPPDMMTANLADSSPPDRAL